MTEQEKREKVIKGLENCTDEIKCRDCLWETCEEMNHKKVELPLDLAKSALSLLKAQEPKQPRVSKNAYDYKNYYCPKCDSWFEFQKYPYCPWCGQAVKWDG